MEEFEIVSNPARDQGIQNGFRRIKDSSVPTVLPLSNISTPAGLMLIRRAI